MTTSTWSGSASGDWSDAADWTGGVPNSATANATIAQTGTYTVDISSGESFTANMVALDDASATLQIVGTLNLRGTLKLTAGTLDLSGTISGGTIAGKGMTTFAGGTLSGVKYEATLDLSAASSESLYVTNGLTLTGANGSSAGAVNLTGTSSGLYFADNNEVLNDATVTFGGSGNVIYADYALTLGTTLAIVQSAADSDDDLTGATIVGDGSITLTANGGNFNIGANSFTNDGTITLSNGDTLIIQGGTNFANAGTLSASGATINFNETWTNTGKVEVTSSTVDFGADVTTALFDLFTGDNDSLTIDGGGTVENAGATLTVGTGSGFSPIMFEGTISGGTIVDDGSGFDFAGGTLDDVTYQGPLDLSGTSADVYVTGGLTLTGMGGGAVNLTGISCSLYFLDSETFKDAAVTFGGSENQIYAYGTLTLGSGLSIVQSAAGSFDTLAGMAIVNSGTIALSANGGTFFIAPDSFTNNGLISVSNGDVLDLQTSFINAGELSANGAIIDFNGPWTNTGTVEVTNSNVNFLSGETDAATAAEFELFAGQNDTMEVGVGGVLDNAGATLTVGEGSGFSPILLEGFIDGGTIADGGSGFIFDGGELSDVKYEGALNLSGQQLYIADGLTLTGAGGHGRGAMTVTGSGSGAGLYVLDSETFNNATVTFGGSGNEIYAYETLTLGSGLIISQTASGSSDSLAGMAIVSDASIRLSASDGDFTISPGSFSNDGVITVSKGDTLTLQGGTFANAGQLSATGATIVFNEAATNTGTVEVGNSTVDFSYDASVDTAFFELFAGQKDTITIGYDATLDNAGAVLTVGNGSGFSPITFEGTISGGTIVDGGSGFDLNGGTLSGVKYQGVLDLSAASASVYVENGLTLTGAGGNGAGAVNLTGNDSSLVFIDSETFSNATVTVGGSNDYIGAFNNLTLGQNLSIIQSAAGSSDTLGGADAAAVVNDGTITASANGGTFNVEAQSFTNNGEIIVSNGDTFDVGANVETVVGGTYEVEAGSTIELGVQITTDDATIILSGEGSTFEAFNPINNQTTTLDATLTAIGAGGALELLYGRSFDTSSAFSNAGMLELDSDSFTAASLTEAAGSMLLGNGAVDTAVANSGTIQASNGTLILEDGVSGAGGFQIDKGATLELTGSITSTGTVTFTADGGSLALTTPNGFSNTIFGFAAGDSIDLLKTAATSAVLNASGQLVVTDNGAAVATFNIGKGASKATFSTVSDGNGGTLIETTSPLVTGPAALTELSGLAVMLTGYQVADAAPSAQSSFTVTVSDKTGLLSATAEDGGMVTGAGTTTLTLSGSLAAAQAELATLTYTGGATGAKPTLTDTLTMTAGATTGGSYSLTTTITVDHLPPVTTAPATATVASGKATAITGISVADADPTAGTSTFTVTLTDKVGVLSAIAATGGRVTGSDTKSLTLSGSLTAVDKELASLTYTGSLSGRELVGGDTITVKTSDGHGDSNTQTIAVTIDKAAAAGPDISASGSSQAVDLFGQSVAAGFGQGLAGQSAMPTFVPPTAQQPEPALAHH